MVSPTPPCPRCGSASQVVPVVYGMPSPQTEERAARGEVELGGCIVRPDFPAWYCRACELDFGQLADEQPEWFTRT